MSFEQQTEILGQARAERNATGAANENDFQTDIQFLTVDGLERKANRYIFFAGDLMTDAQKRSRKDFRIGGEYFGQDFPALAISNYFLYRARITPVTMQPRPMSADEKISNPEIERYQGKIQIQGEQPVRMQYVKTYPGDQLETIVHGARTGVTKGVVELIALQGNEYGERENADLINDLQIKFFPEWIPILRGEADLPETLRGLEELILNAMAKTPTDTLLTEVGQGMLESARQFRVYGTTFLEREAIRIRAGVNPNGGYVHNYSPTGVVLLRQLEIERESLVNRPSVAAAVEARPSDDRLADAFLQVAETNRQLLEQNRLLINRELERTAGAETPADAVRQPSAPAPEKAQNAPQAGGNNSTPAPEAPKRVGGRFVKAATETETAPTA